MTYVMSDLHGCYQMFLDMLEQIAFSDQDTLYILGDFIDRGEAPVPLLLDCMARSNVYPLLGNHEAIMLRCLNDMPDEANKDTIFDYYTEDGLALYSAWMQNGGAVTASQFLELEPSRRQAVLQYLRSSRVFREVTLENGRRFVLTHSGIEDFDPEKPLSAYPVTALIDARPKQSDRFFEDRTLVFGHTPTLTYPQMHGRAAILFTDTYINIDCGAVFSRAGGRLACLRLDDMAEFYVPVGTKR